MEELQLQELQELILDEAPESIWYCGQDCLWYVDTKWLIGREKGELFEGISVTRCLEKMHEYLLEHANHDDFAGMKITQSGYPDLAKVRIYLKNKREEEEFIKNMMEEKELNLVEILKNAPKGTKLYTPIYGECEFENVDIDNLIWVRVDHSGGSIAHYSFYANGKYFADFGGECLLFPSKENRDWSTFKIESKSKAFQVGDYVKEKDSNDIFRSEKIKGIIGSKTRGDEVLKWLKSQGDVDCSICDGKSEEVIYYVDNNEIKIINKRHSVLFDLVELPRWRADYDEKYYFVSECGEACCSSDVRDDFDNGRFNLGNYFKTREEAEPYAKKVREIFKVIIENAEETR